MAITDKDGISVQANTLRIKKKKKENWRNLPFDDQSKDAKNGVS
jgi:hypothetical protein